MTRVIIQIGNSFSASWCVSSINASKFLKLVTGFILSIQGKPEVLDFQI
jgi:hypothetical protein